MRTALVTGGTRGIGRAIAIALMEAGYRVIANYYSNEIQAQKMHHETGIIVKQWDVSSFEESGKAIQSIYEEYGPIDILINNAGITKDTFLHKMSFEQWYQVVNTNLNSCFNVTRWVIDGMRNRNFGRIVNISSVNGQKGQMGQSNYSAAKAGVIGFTRALALENANKGITVNAIAPGYVDTDMVRSVPGDVLDKIVSQLPMGRLGLAEEIAHSVLFLVDEKTGYITGETMNVNGGQYFN